MNIISDATASQIDSILKNELENPATFVGRINGSSLHEENDVFSKIGALFQFTNFQMETNSNYAAFYDWMTDLYCLVNKYDSFVLVIDQFNDVFNGDFKKQATLRECLSDIIKFWTDEVEHVVVNGSKRNFSVILGTDITDSEPKKKKFLGLF
ncbi:barstar family protein [Periweissella cryptocerci]|nr:barstar family protein [Periweissella cryptocerci]